MYGQNQDRNRDLNGIVELLNNPHNEFILEELECLVEKKLFGTY